MLDLGIRETDFARLIVKTEAFEAIPGKILKAAVDERNAMAVVQL